MSGIHVTDDIVEEFNKLKIEKTYRAIVLGLNETRDSIKLFSTHDRNYNTEQLALDLPQNDCRYVIYDFEYETDENPPRQTTKLILICWVPDNSPIKIKVPFSATKSEVRGALPGIQKDVQASDLSIIDFHELRKECL